MVLPRATRTEFFSRLGVSIDERFPPEKIMEAGDLVDTALAGFDQGELVRWSVGHFLLQCRSKTYRRFHWLRLST
jgi:short-subunit dehydrogenase